MIDIRLPNITGATEREQLQQTKTYLYQLVEQLNWALNNIDTQSNTAVVAPTARSLAPIASGSAGKIDAETTFASIKSLIIKSADIVTAYTDEINKKLLGYYKAESDFGTFVEATKADIEANSKNISTSFTNIQTVETNLYDATVGLQGNINALTGIVNGHDTAIQDVKDGTEQSIAAVQGEVEGLSGEIDTVKTDVDEKTKALDEAIKATDTVVKKVTGIIKSGVIGKDDNGDDVIGIMIGQTNTENDVEVYSAYASFTSNRLSFYNADGQEVAYISDRKLYITHAEIISSFKLGGFVDTVMSNGNVVTKWVGGY